MSSRAQQFSIEQRCAGVGAGTDDIGVGSTGLGVGSADRKRRRELSGERFRFCASSSADQDRLIVLEAGEDKEMGTSFTAGSKDRQRRRVFASEITSRQGRGGGSPDFREAACRNGRSDLGGAAVEEQIGR